MVVIKELLSSVYFWLALFAVWLMIISPAVTLCRWARHRVRWQMTCDPTKNKKKVVIKTIFKALWHYLLALDSSLVRDHLESDVAADIKKYDHEIAIATQGPIKAKLPDAPRWHCTCGRINEPHTATCVCGKNMRDVPDSHKYPTPKETVWHCTCGRENPNYTSTCVCGQTKRKLQS